MVNLSKEEVAHVAKLARIAITEQEAKTYAEQLSEVLTYIETLNEVHTEGIEPLSHATGMKAVLREDKVEEFDNVAGIIGQFPEHEGRQNKVRQIK